MEINVISLENRKGVKLGETKKVRRGHARYLVRTKKALPYDKAELEQFSKMRSDLEHQEAQRLTQAQARADKLKELSIQIASRAQEEGQLYGSLGSKEIAEAVSEKGVSLDKKDIHLEQGLIRRIGDHEVMVHLHDAVKVKITIQVIPASS
jgi:large subunit ribosomal protein L9